jgi:cytochrome c2
MRLRTYLRVIGFVLGFVATLLLSWGCSQENQRTAAAMTGGDPLQGKRLLRTYGCHSCHTIPGVPGADGLVGPPLVGIAKRVYIAGRLPNTPENMILWLQHPQAVDPQTAMPNMGVTEADARDMAGYLYTLTTNTSVLPSVQFYNWAQPLLAAGKWVSRGRAQSP